MDTTRPSLLLRVRDPADEGAWRTFDALYRPMLERFARARGLGATDAEEVAQQCLAAIATHIRDFSYDPQKGRFKGWLRTLVNNRVRSLRRAGPLPAGGEAELAEAEEREPTPDAAFEQIWIQEHLWHCLRAVRNEVEEKTFRAFQAYVIEQQPVEQVCAALNLTPSNVYTIKWRLTERIAAWMHELVDGTE